MSENRLVDYLDHMQQAATNACEFSEGLSKDQFLADKRTQSAVVMSLIIVGEAATKGWSATPRSRRRTARCHGAAHRNCRANARAARASAGSS